MTDTPLSSGNPGSSLSSSKKTFKSLRSLVNEQFPIGILAYTLLRCEAALRHMCFLDNESGAAEKSHVEAIASRCVTVVNTAFAANRRPIRIFSITPLPKKHHHIQIEWGIISHLDENGEMTPMQPLEPFITNMYEPSKRALSEDAEETEERVGPRRGEKLRRPKKSEAVLSVKKKRRDSDDTEEAGESSDSYMREMATA